MTPLDLDSAPHPVAMARTAHIASAKPGMQPVTIGGCFGWLHGRFDAPASETAVLICSDVGNDRLNAHRSLRQFADLLAANGYPTLRFDYPDTGDADDVGEVEHWDLWQRSVADAADWLRGHTGARQVVFAGLRIGAMLASLVAESRDDVAGLLLLEPTLRGRSYIRQLSFGRHFRPSASDGRGELDAHGLYLSSATVSRIAASEMREIRPPPDCPVAVFHQSSSPVLTHFVDAWRGFGAAVVSGDFTGLDPLLRPSFMNHEPSANFSRPLAWLHRHVPAKEMPFVLAAAPSYVPLRGEHWIETPYRFGTGNRLFGILCRPATGTPPEAIVIIANSAGNPRAGDNRQGVRFARRLAREGIASLRLDLAGIGDSLSPGEDQETPTHIVETDRNGDISAALDALQSDGFCRFAVQGLCTGAYHALYGAVADERISALLLVNMPILIWRRGDRVETIGARTSAQYVRMLTRPMTWVRLLQGRIDMAYPLYRFRMTFMPLARAVFGQVARAFGRTMPLSFAQRAMAKLCQRGVRTQILYASEDGGIENLEREFGQRGRGLRNVDIHFIPQLDHSLSCADMRHIAEECMVTFLKQNWRA